MKVVAVFAFAAVIVTNGCANSPVSLTPQAGVAALDSCAGYPRASGPAGSIDDVSSEPSAQAATCRARAALAAGQFVVSYTNDALLAAVNGDTAASDVDEDGALQSLLVGKATPEPAPTGAAAETTEPVHAYGTYIDPASSVEYTLSAGAYTAAQAELEVTSWVNTTIAQARNQALSSRSTRGLRSPQAFVGEPSYDRQAWTLVSSATSEHNYPVNTSPLNPPLFSGTATDTNVPEQLGSNSLIVKVYRYNTNLPAVDDFLVDASYTQRPNWTGKKVVGIIGYWFWWNYNTKLRIFARYPWFRGFDADPVRLVDYAPQQPVTTAETTNSVGSKFSLYSVTTKQPSVTTIAAGGQQQIEWTDKYVDIVDAPGPFTVINESPPATTTSQFSGDRLAILEVPRGINDEAPPGATPGLDIDVTLNTIVAGFRGGFIGLAAGDVQRRYFTSDAKVFAPEPVFAASPKSIDVSMSKNSATSPAIVNVTAEVPNSGEKLTWKLDKPALDQGANVLGTNVGANGITGSDKLEVFPLSTAKAGDSAVLLLNSSPPRGSDTLRNGPLQIKVKVVQ